MILFWLLLMLMYAGVSVYGVSLKICTDENFWYPFSYSQNGESKGLHIDVVTEACRQLGWKCGFTPLPWKRCLEVSAKRGFSDTVVAASYKADRTEVYP